ncbi:hypothetical protein CQW23_20537 [Capsicum baccatum]|uniref:Uncharacterized protein n=1 Tax=Capsicum baccatum TaxID=33114 RepID=A0A2G2W8W7_CAPBA|nr:hypothetical protein CQW23_20537 [Capsicum baccatum]
MFYFQGFPSNPNILSLLPEDCTGNILVFTRPVDVYFNLPLNPIPFGRNFCLLISGSVTPIPDFASKKYLYVNLCHNPILIDAGRKSFSLEKCTGKKCYILGARDLHITWADSPQYWEWTSLPDSRCNFVDVMLAL